MYVHQRSACRPTQKVCVICHAHEKLKILWLGRASKHIRPDGPFLGLCNHQAQQACSAPPLSVSWFLEKTATFHFPTIHATTAGTSTAPLACNSPSLAVPAFSCMVRHNGLNQ
jgi:hypothetical protein